MKKVIFIGGTSYSGSTLLDMILSNDEKGFSLGEINAIFRPYRLHHLQLRTELLSNKVWEKIILDGENKLLPNLFETYQNVDFFVDSSKDPFWIKNQNDILNAKNIKFYNLLIYKTPEELSHSFHKRGILSSLEKHIKSYYTMYYYLIQNFVSISYKDLTTSNYLIKKICDYLEINYFEG